MKCRLSCINDPVVGVFGLTGDPFTVAHRAICKQAMDKLPIDKLYVIPTIVTYHRKDKEPWLDDFDRLKCAKNMLWSLGPDYLGKWEVDRHELDLKYLASDIDLGKDSCEQIVARRRFLHTLLDFKCRVGISTRVMLILGTDSLKNLSTWYRWRDVCSKISSLVVVNGRDGEEIEIPEEVKTTGLRDCNLHLEGDEFLDDELLKVSASKVRAACRRDYLGVDTYFETVLDYDRGKVSLKELGWI